MIRYGVVAEKMRPMNADDLLISSLKLLIIMAKANLKGYPMGDFRKSAMAEIARFVFLESLSRTASHISAGSKPDPASRTAGLDTQHIDHLFLQRIQLLAVMLNSMARGKSRGRYRKKAMAENVEQICSYLSDRFQLGDVQILKVA